MSITSTGTLLKKDEPYPGKTKTKIRVCKPVMKTGEYYNKDFFCRNLLDVQARPTGLKIPYPEK